MQTQFVNGETIAPEIVPMRHPVLLRKLDSQGRYHYGVVVTHLNLDEWCQMRGYRIVAIYSDPRPARKDERTTINLRP